jgi:hypothetical protein
MFWKRLFRVMGGVQQANIFLIVSLSKILNYIYIYCNPAYFFLSLP